MLRTSFTDKSHEYHAIPEFDAFIAIDWSGAMGRYGGIAVSRCEANSSRPRLICPPNGTRWTRSAIADWICNQLSGSQRLLIGLDFAFGFPFEDRRGYLGGRAKGIDSIFELWRFIEESSFRDPDFGCSTFTSHARYKSLFWTSGPLPGGWRSRKRRTEIACAEVTQTRPETVYKLLGSKQVGKASITGIRVLNHIRAINSRVTFWPFENAQGSVMVEIYPTLFRKSATGSVAKLRSASDLNRALKMFGSRPIAPTDNLSDHHTDALISAAGLRSVARNLSAWSLPDLAAPRVQREGWIFGVHAL